MAETSHVMIALQTPDGLAFGYVLDASPRHVVFVVNGNIPVGSTFAWRMELRGYSETIMGQLTITKVQPPRGSSDWPRYDASVSEIPPEDAALLAVWMEDQEKGGSSRRIEQDPERFIKDMFSEGMRSATMAQTKLVIDRMNERRERREQLFKKQKRGVGGDFGLSRESNAPESSVSKAVVRSRISSALGDFARRKNAEPQPAPPPAETKPRLERANPTGTAPARPAPPTPAKPAAPEVARISEEVIAAALQAAGLQAADVTLPTPPAPPTEPAFFLHRDTTPPLLELRYPQLGDYANDYARHMKNGGFFLAKQQIGARGDKLRVRLHTPAGVVECPAEVVAVMAAGTGLMLTLTKEQRATLAAAAR